MFFGLDASITEKDSGILLENEFQLENAGNNGSCFISQGYGLGDSKLCLAVFCTLVTMGLTVVGVNIAVLQASKFASAGQNSTLIFIRSFCTGDMIIGIFGIIKGLHLAYGIGLKINLFLSESLFFTANTAVASCHAWLAVEMYLKLAKPLGTKFMLEKNNVIALMIVLWNCAFILGFLPQLGWHTTDYAHEFFQYYDWRYLLFMSFIWELCYLCVLLVQVYTALVVRAIRHQDGLMSVDTMEFKRCYNLILTSRLDLCLWFFVYIPAIAYIGLVCSSCAFGNISNNNETYILWVYTALLGKSLLNGIVHGYRTPQIRVVFKNLLTDIYDVICHPSRLFRSCSGQATLASLDRNSQTSGVSVITLTSTLHSADLAAKQTHHRSKCSLPDETTSDTYDYLEVTRL
ncbi:adenosine receptor A2b-like [Liolophura sinensis]|uniref:adenosine receptor A2b-like n=1 Tax=Liolophura sinensis TaxID=3198878 RepID=UPI003158496E